MENQPDTSEPLREVIVQQIEKDKVILSCEDTGESISWPIHLLSQPLLLHEKLFITLQTERGIPVPVQHVNSSHSSQMSKKGAHEDHERRKLLEQMIN